MILTDSKWSNSFYLLFDLASDNSANWTDFCFGVWLQTQSSSFFSATATAVINVIKLFCAATDDETDPKIDARFDAVLKALT